jgi:MFS family permease
MVMKSRSFLKRTILLVSFVSLFTDIASEMLYPVMPVYLRSIGFSVLLIGILEGVAEATAGLSKGYFGHLSDTRRKRVPFIRTGYSLSAVSKPLLALFTFPVWIFFARTLDRLGKGIRTSARDAMLSDESKTENKGKVFGFHRSMDTAGAAVGPFVALLFLAFYPGHYRWMFVIAFFPGLLAILLTFFLREKKKEPGLPVQSNSGKRIGFFSFLGYWKRAGKGFRMLVAGLLLFSLLNSSDVFLLLALKNRQVSDTGMIGFYIFYNLVYALSSFPMGIIADRIGLKTVLVSGLVLFAAVYVTMGFAASFAVFGVLFFFYGLYAAATEGISKALITTLAGEQETATALGFYNSLASVCTLGASTLAGVVWFAWGPQVMFLVSGIGVFLVAVYLLVIFRVAVKKA